MKNFELTFCHRLPERSFFWKGKQFPVCARCTGIHIGYLSMPIFFFGFASLSIWTSLLLMAPTYLDGILQAIFNYESTNTRRVVTGFIGGIGSMSLVSHIGIAIGKYLLTFL